MNSNIITSNICTICNEPEKEGNVCRNCRNIFRPLVCVENDYVAMWPYSHCLNCTVCDLHGFPCAECSIYFNGKFGPGYSTKPISTEFMINTLRKFQVKKDGSEVSLRKNNKDNCDGLYECRYCESKRTIHLSFQSRSSDEAVVICISCQNCETNYVHSKNVSSNTLQTIRSVISGEVLYPDENKTISEPNGNYVICKSTRDHVLALPEIYIGSIDKTVQTTRVLVGGHYETKTVEVSAALYNIFSDVVNSARDQIPFKGEHSRTLDVTIDRQSVKIRFRSNIPITQNKDGIWYPDLIFGRFGTINNQTGKKLSYAYANVFSKEFTIHIIDKKNQIGYKQTWENNMSIHRQPSFIEYHNCKESYTEIEYVLDFGRFGYSEYPNEILQMFGAYLGDISMTHRLHINFNINVGDYRKSDTWKKMNIGQYSLLYNIESEYDSIHWCDWGSIYPNMEFCAYYTPGNGRIISFANGCYTRNGGVHVDSVYDKIENYLIDNNVDISIEDLEKDITLFVSCWVEDPVYKAQAKLSLLCPIPVWTAIPNDILNEILVWYKSDGKNEMIPNKTSEDMNRMESEEEKKEPKEPKEPKDDEYCVIC